MIDKIKNLIRWARITKAGSDKEQFATQQMEYLGKVADGLIVFPYGIHGNVPPGALALMLSIQGNPDNRAAIAWTPKDRPTLAAGEVAFYHPPTGAFIIWRANGDLDIETGNGGSANININCKQANITASESMTFDTPEATFTGNVTINKDLTVDEDTELGTSPGKTVINSGVNIGGDHVHPQGNDSAGNTEQNTGVPQ